MRTTLKVILCSNIFLSLLLPNRSFAQDKIAVDLSLFYFNEGETRADDDGNGDIYTQKSKTNHLFYGLGLCYVSGVWCIGAKYFAGEREGETTFSNSNNTYRSTVELSGYGITLGYQTTNAILHGTYLISAEKRLGDTDAANFGGDTNVEYPTSMAYIIDLGYGFDVQGIRIGPLVRIIHFEYKKVEIGGQTFSLPRTEKDDFVIPHFALWIDM